MNYGIKTSFEFIISARDDYIRANSKSYDCFLYNRDWTLMPSIVIDDGFSCFLLCCYHKNGTKKYICSHTTISKIKFIFQRQQSTIPRRHPNTTIKNYEKRTLFQ